MRRAVIVVAAASAVFGLGAADAHAYIDGGDEACGCAPPGWNAPNGAVVSSRSSGGGPINGVITAIGEYYTHSMLSHGSANNTWVSHTTMRTPGIHMNIFGDDDVDVDELRYGWPGPAQVNMGGIYQSLYGGGSGLEAISYTSGGTAGADAADYLWYGLPHCDDVASGLCYVGAYSLQAGDYSYETEYLFLIGRKLDGVTYRHSYGVYQYADDHEVPAGDDMSDPGWAMQCSSFMAWSSSISGGPVTTSNVWPNHVISPAVYQLHDLVTDECDSGAGWFGGLFVGCSDIADQIVNCFVDFEYCDDDKSSIWKDYAAAGTAESVSPDRVIGINGHSSTGSPWEGNPQMTLQWNSGGSVCGCWF